MILLCLFFLITNIAWAETFSDKLDTIEHNSFQLINSKNIFAQLAGKLYWRNNIGQLWIDTEKAFKLENYYDLADDVCQLLHHREENVREVATALWKHNILYLKILLGD